MSDSPENLRDLLSRLDRELHEVGTLDDASRSLLQEVSRDISAVLQRDRESTAVAPAEHHSLMERLTESVESYEVAHPTIAGLLRRVIDGLAQLGI